MSTLLLSTRDALGAARKALVVGLTRPTRPDNSALDCWRCPHRWHGLDCATAACPCSSSWVDLTLIATIGTSIAVADPGLDGDQA